MEQVLDIPALMQPIPGDDPAGEDMSFSVEFDQIKEARRADDDLPQEEWETELKAAEWPKVIRTATELLSTKTKDLQIAAWLTEALTHTRGFPGLYAGLTLSRELLSGFWDKLHPGVADGVAMRAGKVAWLNATLPAVVAAIPLTAVSEGGLALRHWNEAADVDNVARKDSAAAQRLIQEENKTSSEALSKAITGTPDAFYVVLQADIGACQEAIKALDALVDEKFGKEAPSLALLRKAVDDCAKVVARVAKDRGLAAQEQEAATSEPDEESGERPQGMASGGRLASRQDALRKLMEVAVYFRTHEPHSPVACLVDRAARWATMPFESWLQEVVKDQAQLQALYELLGIRADSNG
jgi:type VI secretion system protein ImpA